MIDKTIHYVWLSNEEMPELHKKCLESWKRIMPEYKIKKWTLKDFDDFNVFVKEAISCKKWAFATDYLRLKILYEEGGIYLDSDVYLKKSFDDLLDNKFISCIEYHKDSINPVIQAAFLGAERNHPYIKSCMEYYESENFILEDGSYNNIFIAPDIYALCMEKFGYEYKNCEQYLSNGIHLYDQTVIAGSPSELDNNNYGIHMCAGSWRDLNLFLKIKIRLSKNALLRKIFMKPKLNIV